jgi:organic radical activating enzyme
MTIKISEIFESIQGEGRYAGYPMLFIRVSDCTRKCLFCDSKYHIKGKEYSVEEIVKIIKKSKQQIVCFTGGEPLLYREQILEIIESFYKNKSSNIQFHLETNGDLANGKEAAVFRYCSYSPKEIKVARRIYNTLARLKWLKQGVADIKIVTDFRKIGTDMLQYATIVMPLTTYNIKKDKEIMKDGWEYCVKNNEVLSLRWQYLVFGNKKGI